MGAAKEADNRRRKQGILPVVKMRFFRMLRLLSTRTLIALLVGCSPNENHDLKQRPLPEDYFPLAAGSSWTYIMPNGGQKQKTIRVGGLRTVTVLEFMENGRPSTHRAQPKGVDAWPLEGFDEEPIYAVPIDKGVHLFAERPIGATGVSRIVPYAQYHWGGEKQWFFCSQWGCIAGGVSAGFLGHEIIRVPAGSFECIKMMEDKECAAFVWLARGVGLVKRTFKRPRGDGSADSIFKRE